MAKNSDMAMERVGPEGRALHAHAFTELNGLTREAIALAPKVSKDDPRLEHQRFARWLGMMAGAVREVASLDLPRVAEPAANSNPSGEDQMGDTQAHDFERVERIRAGLETRLHGLIDQQSGRAEAGGERLGGGAVGGGIDARGGAAMGSEYAPAAA